ncbi:transketolase [Sulfobacillus acidophilus DSM 10332]|uniref:Transketolase n=1 Tax=Sulfobacillus acidophilus (strain ATCC 700253 / DSM 10332 / NAL) TaxID=679936 RepID=G8TWR9_SULAD|nr:transketolase [Sulfobacillus acidophilus DSM 10332]
MNTQSLTEQAITTIRTLAIDAVEKARSGHPGMPMGAAPMAYALWTGFLRHNPQNPQWPNRDRFILSAGHGSMLLYALLYLTGYDLSLEDLKNFRQWGSKTPGHPEYGLTPGVETTTGPLGQGFATGVGMAMAARYLAARFNKPDFPIVDHTIYAIVSDGDLMEGVASEAASLAGTLKLSNLIYLYDDNHISIEGQTDIAFTEDVLKRFEAYGWYTDRVSDGNDVEAIQEAIRKARTADRPALVAVRTTIGYGSPHRQNTAKAHGEPLGPEEARLTKAFYGWTAEPFTVPDAVLQHFRQAVTQGRQWESDWQALFDRYQKAYPELAAEFQEALAGKVPAGALDELPLWDEGTEMATRQASGLVINRVAAKWPTFLGGSADLAPSNNTAIEQGGDFSAENPAGRNLHFGVREHAMGAALNGMSLHGGVRVYGGTFLIFSDYMRPAIRLASLMHQPVVYVFTHDSIGLGEDGPTHQPIEQLASLRAIPGLYVIRPADANETREAWAFALSQKDHPVALALTRQKVPTLNPAVTEGLRRGAYILARNHEKPQLVLLASGSEVDLALKAYQRLDQTGVAVQVVSFPCWELFDQQDPAYQAEVLPAGTRRIAIEAAYPQGWERYVGPEGVVIGLTHFGASAPADRLFQEFGFTVDNVVRHAQQLLSE